jgi:hypothetical protein
VEVERGHPAGPCWVWLWGLNRKGYGRIFEGGRYRLAHRVYYERAHGPIPAGQVLHHTSEVRPCVNPVHLEPLTRAKHIRRGRIAKLTDAKGRILLEEGCKLGKSPEDIERALPPMAAAHLRKLTKRIEVGEQPGAQGVAPVDAMGERPPTASVIGASGEDG